MLRHTIISLSMLITSIGAIAQGVARDKKTSSDEHDIDCAAMAAMLDKAGEGWVKYVRPGDDDILGAAVSFESPISGTAPLYHYGTSIVDIEVPLTANFASLKDKLANCVFYTPIENTSDRIVFKSDGKFRLVFEKKTKHYLLTLYSFAATEKSIMQRPKNTIGTGWTSSSPATSDDLDGDGVSNMADACPSEKGSKENMGCPVKPGSGNTQSPTTPAATNQSPTTAPSKEDKKKKAIENFNRDYTQLGKDFEEAKAMIADMEQKEKADPNLLMLGTRTNIRKLCKQAKGKAMEMEWTYDGDVPAETMKKLAVYRASIDKLIKDHDLGTEL